MELGKRIRELRTKKGIEQLELANKIGISQSKMNKIETGFQKRIEPEILNDIAKTLGIKVDVLLNGDLDTEDNKLDYYKKKIATEFPDIDLMFHDLSNMTAEELEEVYEFVKFKRSQNKDKD
ncbi:helix-turn-helix domain-containing protein [Ornithinibacillus sp. JPR2-1]|uniref:helix-turn-helix domain-containing protein n=1 Tax=Ornithinibacillus sp. JPR2-1 TaxID=2094019 RepID=UPI0031D0CD38